MFTNSTLFFRRRLMAVLGACSLVFAAANAPADNGRGEQSAAFPSMERHAAMLGAADLERAFWICDYFATTQGVDRTPADFCSAVYEELKTARFEGDFEQLHMWWKDRKAEEFERLATGGY